ncbi:hypothetical protein L0Z65_18600 (plasmid) [Phaeobacter sp. BS52]|uniref:hypothetical protein n=1 Tax=Phaeobacter sp. BS52 TaxID=2907241 RepID=UPI003868EFEE
MAEAALWRMRGRRRAPLDRRLLVLAGLLIGAAASFISWGLPWSDGAPSAYILQLRATKLAGLICVGRPCDGAVSNAEQQPDSDALDHGI